MSTEDHDRVVAALRAELAEMLAKLEDATAANILASQELMPALGAWSVLDDYDGSGNGHLARELEAKGWRRSGDGAWYAPEVTHTSVPDDDRTLEARVRRVAEEIAIRIEAECIDQEWPNDAVSINGMHAAGIAREIGARDA